ncbi:MAG: hypothetical protein JWR68_2065 [Polaromonas sp.]|nr:hypothetical protein [Polaromonas sp.]
MLAAGYRVARRVPNAQERSRPAWRALRRAVFLLLNQ